jgi:colicin import membrane protein
MKAGLTSSVILHAAVIGFGLVSLSAPKPMEVADVEAMPIDIVPIEELTQVQEGVKEAPLADRSAPTPTNRPDIVPDAQRVGENAVDTQNEPAPDAPQRPAERATQAPPKADPVPVPAPVRPEPAPAEAETPPAEPTTEVAAIPKPEQKVEPEPQEAPAPEPDPVREVIEEPQPEFAALPSTLPAPARRPTPRPAEQQEEAKPQAQTAATPNRKTEAAAKPARQQASESSETKLEDDIAALLNKEKAAGGGAKKSTDQAALGGTRTTGGAKLSASEMDALRQQIQACWNPPFGAEESGSLRVSVSMQLLPDGTIDGRPTIESTGNSGVQRAAAEAARRAVLSCAPYRLPADKYETWQQVVVNFDPQDLFR